MVLEPRSESFRAFPKEALDQSIIARFREQVERLGDRPAVVSGVTTITYDQLDRRANRVANALLTTSGQDQEPVALLMDQGPLTIVGILGALKAGKIYLPLDPHEPEEGMANKLADAGASLILVDSAHQPLGRDSANFKQQMIDITDAAAGASESDPDLDLGPDSLAYIYYTSGSTGSPKGVFDTHRNVLHNILRYTNTLKISREDALSLIQVPNFSGTVSTLFGGLLNGATLNPMDLRSEGIAALSRCIREHRLTMFHSVPSILEQLVRTGDPFPSLQVIRLEGDQTFKRHVDLFQRHFSDSCVLVNGLGATETGLTRQFVVSQSTKVEGNLVPIGYATPDMESIIWSPDGQEVPPGEVGEIVIRSPYLAKGYWRKPELTKRVFAACRRAPRSRTYRTGDLGKLRSDGCLEYLGRRDYRTKIHGQWVDLQAVEQELCSIPAVSEALALSRSDTARGATIVAYLVLEGSSGLHSFDLRRTLRKRLPDYMVPSNFVFLDALPLDANGKLDRKALPAPNPASLAAAVPLELPRSETELRLARCWCNVLDLTEVGINGDFYEMGGDSFRALELVLQIEQTFGVRLPLSLVIEAPTVSEMAVVLEEKRAVPFLLPLGRSGSKRPFFCVHGHDGEVLQLRELARSLDPDRPVYGFRLPDGMGLNGRAISVESMARQYLDAMRGRQPEGPYLLGGYCFGGLVAVEMARLLAAEGQGMACLALIAADAPGRATEATSVSWLPQRWKTFRSLSARARSRYVVSGCANVVRAISRHARMRLGGYLWDLYKVSRRRPPAILRSPALICDIAANRYDPHPYGGGRAVVFGCPPEVSNPTGPYAGWRDLISRGLDTRVVDATTSNIMKPPGVALLARELDAVLYESDAASTRSRCVARHL